MPGAFTICRETSGNGSATGMARDFYTARTWQRDPQNKDTINSFHERVFRGGSWVLTDAPTCARLSRLSGITRDEKVPTWVFASPSPKK